MTRILLSLLLGATIASAADQTILGSQLLVKNPSTPEKRTVVGKAKESASPNTIVGDPTLNGATLTVRAEGTASPGPSAGPPRPARSPRATAPLRRQPHVAGTPSLVDQTCGGGSGWEHRSSRRYSRLPCS